MMRIHISSTVDPAILRQTEDGNGRWKDAQFFLNSDEKECDFWAVIEDIPEKSLTKTCNPKNILLITTEPPEIKKYPKRFLQQFGSIITSHEIDQPVVWNEQQGLPWMVGVEYVNKESKAKETYASFKTKEPVKDGSDTICIIASKKKYTEVHAQRDIFIEYMKKEFGDQVKVYGNGYEVIKDKGDVLFPAKYQIVMENSHIPDYWTEKLSDAFLSYNYPFYYGCTNIEKYFDRESLTEIDIYKPEEAAALIKKLISENMYEKRLGKIREARDRVLDEYNIFEVIYRAAQGRVEGGETESATLFSQEASNPFGNIRKKIQAAFRKLTK